jgi:lysophospholipase L1-like esterase
MRILHAIVALLLPLATAGLHAAEPPRIMAVGDSITQGGGNSFATYRHLLADLLLTKGRSFEFVGSQTSQHAGVACRHEGYGGKNAEFLASILEAKLRAHPADLVMIQAGHNHSAEEKPVPGIVEAQRRMIAIARQQNPAAIVLIAQVIPSAKLPKYAYLPDLNAALAKLAQEMHSPAQPVLLVDLATGFDPATDTVADKVHPNQAGAAKIAERWAAALSPLLPARNR